MQHGVFFFAKHWTCDLQCISIDTMEAKQRLSLRISLAGSLVIAVLLTSLLLGGVTFAMWKKSLRDDLIRRMSDLAGAAALLVDPGIHAGLVKPSDMEGPAYNDLRSRLLGLRSLSSDIHFLYTFRLAPGDENPRFVLDTGTPGKDFSPLGEEYQSTTDTLRSAFSKPWRVRVERSFYSDQWGTWLSAYAPILRPDGTLEAVLGMDMDAGRIILMENNLLLLMTGLTVGIILLMGGFSLVIAKRIARPLLALSQDMGRIQELQLEADLEINTNISEVAIMHVALENMKMGLRSFRKFVPADLVTQLISMQKEAVLGTSKQELTIFFCDLENSTTAGEMLSSEDLNRLMTGYFQTVTRILQKHGATVDKFIGDAVMAFWNAPLPLPDHALRGARASLEIRKEMDIQQLEWQDKGLPALATRIGLNTGIVLVGNVGHEKRLSYTAMGDAVNLASRLESLNKYYGTRILVGEETLARLGDALCR